MSRAHMTASVDLDEEYGIVFDPQTSINPGTRTPFAVVDLVDGLRLYAGNPDVLDRAAAAFAEAAQQLRDYLATPGGAS